jgi:hypothetical protein
VINSLLDAIDEKVDEERFDRVVEAQRLQTEEYKPEYVKLDSFKDILPSIMERKRHILTDSKDYVPFTINHMLSYHDDTLYFANEMNMMWHLNKEDHDGIGRRMQYDFYFHAIRARRRPWAKWIKPIKADDLAAVKLYFGYSDAKARQCLNILTEDQLCLIREQTAVGD